MIPASPDWMMQDELAVVAWRTAYRAVVVQMPWEDLYVTLMASLASSAADYCRLVLEKPDVRIDIDPNDIPEIRKLRLLVREMMADFLILRFDQIFVGEIRSDGLDADIAKLCGIAAPAPKAEQS
jgi:hypothetical protein